jgi:hypothetical protein
LLSSSELNHFRQLTSQKLEAVDAKSQKRFSDLKVETSQRLDAVDAQSQKRFSDLKVDTERNVSGVLQAYRATGNLLNDVSHQVRVEKIFDFPKKCFYE